MMMETEKNLDNELWYACAGSMVQVPSVNSLVFYFPQGHAEHASCPIDFSSLPGIPALIRCRVAAVKLLADTGSDEVYANIELIPLAPNEADNDVVVSKTNGSDNRHKPSVFAKTLTQSDANNGGGFSVPRYCAETIFPRLNYNDDPPVQNVIAKDIHGETWKFRHIYRGTPRRHLLTTGWSSFVNHKKLVAGDSVVFLRGECGDICVGIRRTKRGNANESFPCSGPSYGQGCCVNRYGGSHLVGEEEGKTTVRTNSRSNGRFGEAVGPDSDSVLGALTLAANGQPFQIVYYPRGRTLEFFMKASVVRDSMMVSWRSGLRFKMPFETEDSSKISWFMGTVSSVQFVDPARWPNSPWRVLQVEWDEEELLQNVKCVSPWLVELVTNMPVIHLSPPNKKLRLLQPLDFSLDGPFHVPLFSGNSLSNNTPAGIQGARHAQFGRCLSHLHLNDKLLSSVMTVNSKKEEKLSCFLTIRNSSQNIDKCDNLKRHQFFLFGKPILTEHEISCRSWDYAVSQNETTEPKLHSNCCKVFINSEDVGMTFDLSVIGSYEELFRQLANMFPIESFEMFSHVVYQDASGAVKKAGDEAFSDFIKSAKSLTITVGSRIGSLGKACVTSKKSADENGTESNW